MTASPAPPRPAARAAAVVLPSIADAALAAAHAHAADPAFGVRDLAAALGISAGYLTVRLRRETGGTAVALLRTVRLERAHARLASGAAASVAAAAAEAGFRTAEHFSRVYRQAYGHPPRTTLRAARAA